MGLSPRFTLVFCPFQHACLNRPPMPQPHPQSALPLPSPHEPVQTGQGSTRPRASVFLPQTSCPPGGSRILRLPLLLPHPACITPPLPGSPAPCTAARRSSCCVRPGPVLVKPICSPAGPRYRKQSRTTSSPRCHGMPPQPQPRLHPHPHQAPSSRFSTASSACWADSPPACICKKPAVACSPRCSAA